MEKNCKKKKKMRIEKALKNDRVMRALTGVDKKEFEQLVPVFKDLLEENFRNKKDRKRKIGGGRKGHLKEVEDKVFYILLYMKVYPTFDVAGFLFDTDKSRACRWVQQFLPILEKTLGRTCDLPKRKISSVEEFLREFPEVKDVLIDGTERPINRPKNPKNQKKNYSGKKKCHTRKNTIVTDTKKRILLVSPTKSGKIHDKKQLDKLGVDWIPQEIYKWVDSGYQGIQHIMPNTFLPKKSSKKNPLSNEDKEDNKFISSTRILVENAIGGMKRYGCLTQKLRNRIGIDDSFILVGAALWNFHLRVR